MGVSRGDPASMYIGVDSRRRGLAALEHVRMIAEPTERKAGNNKVVDMRQKLDQAQALASRYREHIARVDPENFAEVKYWPVTPLRSRMSAVCRAPSPLTSPSMNTARLEEQDISRYCAGLSAGRSAAVTFSRCLRSVRTTAARTGSKTSSPLKAKTATWTRALAPGCTGTSFNQDSSGGAEGICGSRQGTPQAAWAGPDIAPNDAAANAMTPDRFNPIE